MKICFSTRAWEDYLYWQETDRRVNELIKDIRRSPYEGIGKAEPLMHQLSGF